jgi:hypothetical protein
MFELTEIMELVKDRQPAPFMEPKLTILNLNTDHILIDLSDTCYENRTDDYRIELETDIIDYMMQEGHATYEEVMAAIQHKTFLVHFDREL